MKARIGTIVGWIATILVSALTIFSGIMKFVPVDPASEGAKVMADLGVTPELAPILGILELVIVTLFLVPRTSTVGTVLLIGYFGGVLATLLTHGATFADTSMIYIVFLLIMISAWFRNPELVSRLLKRPVQV